MDSGALLDLLGNENRRRILRLLARKPCYVTEISEYLDVSPKAVIDHLRQMEEAGLVESRTDDQRRKYFHIAQNLRLEVQLSPFDFGAKSAYPASADLDLTRCQYVSVRVTEERQDDVAALAGKLEELKDLERELSLAQRWVQGRLADVQNRLADAVGDGHERLYADVLSRHWPTATPRCPLSPTNWRSPSHSSRASSRRCWNRTSSSSETASGRSSSRESRFSAGKANPE
jgi:ArsR family transcriptional regulator